MSKKVVTGVVRLSYAHVWEAAKIGENGKEKFSVSLIISEDDKETLDKINKAIEEAIQEGVNTKFGGKRPNQAALKLPLRSGDEKDDPAYEHAYFLNANSNTAPQIVDKECQPILDRGECVSGDYARVSITFYPYNVNGNKGVACGLGNIQVIRKGEPLGGKSNAQTDFKDFM